MAKLVYFPWYPAEAAMDGWWMSLTLQEQALHLRLLSFAWVNGGLNKDLNRVATSVGLSRQEFDKYWPAVAEKWALNGLVVVNKRQEEERAKVKKISDAAASSANKRWDKERNANASEPYMQTHCESNARASGSDSISISSGSADLMRFEIRCEAAYARHPKKKNKASVRLVLKQKFFGRPDLMERFEKNHQLWCVLPSWQEQNGRFVPPLDEWVVDDAWWSPPTGDGNVTVVEEFKGYTSEQIWATK